MNNWYKELKHRFATFPSNLQILNMISDLKKADNLWTANRQSAINHLYRAIILLDYMVDDPKWNRKLRELLRLREVIGSLIVADKPFATLSQTITITLLLEPTAYQSVRVKAKNESGLDWPK